MNRQLVFAILVALSLLEDVSASGETPLLPPSVPQDRLNGDLYAYYNELYNDFVDLGQKKKECLASEAQQASAVAGRRSAENRADNSYQQIDASVAVERKIMNKRGDITYVRQQIYVMYQIAYREQELLLACLDRVGGSQTTTPDIVGRGGSSSTDAATSTTETATTTVQPTSPSLPTTVPTPLSSPTVPTTTVTVPTTVPTTTEAVTTTVSTSAPTTDISGRGGTTVGAPPLEILTKDKVYELVDASLTEEQFNNNYIWISDLLGRIISRLTSCQTRLNAINNASITKREVNVFNGRRERRQVNTPLVIYIVVEFYKALDAQTKLQECEAKIQAAQSVP